MSAADPPLARHNAIKRHPVAAYFILTFLISWAGAFAVAAPWLLRHRQLTQLTGILMFPAMLLGPCISGVLLTGIIDGGSGLRVLRARIFKARVPARWYAPLLIPPVLILAVLFCFRAFVSPVYAPNFFLFGLLFGLPAGLLEEIGWTGFAFPRMTSPRNALGPAILLGLMWSTWHLPAINYLGVATPHRSWWLPFFFAFLFAMTAVRVLISWIYTNTRSVLLAQLMHISSTGSLVVFSAVRVSPAQETLWYTLYGAALWIAVVLVAARFGRRLTRSKA